jgi:alpha-1,3-mannosyltransferase
MWDQHLNGEGHRYKTIVFLNDIFFCPSDLYELLWQAELQQADLTCGWDVIVDEKNKIIYLYDIWVTRNADGDVNSFSHERDELVPQKVMCCWNGMAVLNAAPFYQEIKFRRQKSVDLASTDPRFDSLKPKFPQAHLYANCSGSEMTNMCMDFHRHGLHRMVMVPSVLLAYDVGSFEAARRLKSPMMMPVLEKEDDKLEFGQGASSMVCQPLNSPDKSGPDGPEGREAI